MFKAVEIMTRRGISGADAARAAGVSRSAVSKALDGIYPGDPARIRRKIGEALSTYGVTESELAVLWEEDGTKEKPISMEDNMINNEVWKHFGFTEDPFGAPESAEALVRTRNLVLAEETVTAAAERHQLVAVVGDTGSGKSTAAESALARLRKSGKLLVVFPQPVIVDRLTASIICNEILQTAGGEAKPWGNIGFRANRTKAALERAREAGKKVLLVVEEAHLLHTSTLAAMKRFHEIRYGFLPLLGICLIGQRPLIQMLDKEEQKDVAARIRIADMMPMGLDEIRTYLEERTAGRLHETGARLFGEDAVRFVAAHAKHPLEIDNVARGLLVKAWSLGERAIGRDILTA